MKQIRFLLTFLAALSLFAALRAPGQVSVQLIHLSLTSQFESDSFVVNDAAAATNEASLIRKAFFNADNIRRSIRLDLGNSNEWAGAYLVREVNLATGAEGIFLRLNDRQTNVSEFFDNSLGSSYTNDFTGQVTNWFPAITNNFAPLNPLEEGSVRYRSSGTVTNYPTGNQFVFASFNSMNLKFNLLGHGSVIKYTVRGRMDGVVYSNQVNQIYANVIGTAYHNRGTNVFNAPGVPPDFVSGPCSGVFWTSAPHFAAITNGP